MSSDLIEWTVVIPLKTLPRAKSRLAVGLDRSAHARLVEAIRTDTLAIAAGAAGVARVLVIYDGEPTDPSRMSPERAGPDPVSQNLVSLVQQGDGLNAALREGALEAARRWPAEGVAALVGDLPALRADELEAALVLAASHPRSFVADTSGAGTTLLAARPGVALEPQFGLGSAARHAQVAHLLAAGPGLRLDVDTAADLDRARELGVGPATSAVLE